MQDTNMQYYSRPDGIRPQDALDPASDSMLDTQFLGDPLASLEAYDASRSSVTTADIEAFIKANSLDRFLEDEPETEIVFEPSLGETRSYLSDPSPSRPRKGRSSEDVYASYLDEDEPRFASEFRPEPKAFREKTMADLDGFCNRMQGLVSPSYAVGGCVRDALLGIPTHDYDFCTPLKPRYLEATLKRGGLRLRTDGLQFGTLGFKMEGRYVEITTFRTDKYQPGSRYPEVEFVDRLETDLGRRDFTINAMAFIGGNIIDPFDGYYDLTSRTVRCIGKAQMRLEQDPLRILRAARLVSQLDFHMDLELQQAIKNTWHLLSSVSRARWGTEMTRLLAGANPVSALNILRKSGALALLLPEVANLNDHAWGVATSAMKKVKPVRESACENLVVCPKGPNCLKGAADRNNREKYVANRRLALLLAFISPEPVVLHESARRLAFGLEWDEVQLESLCSIIDEMLDKTATGQEPGQFLVNAV